MRLFADYIEPLTIWLHFHPNSALFMAFFIAFIESLAVVGSIIPGTVVMTAVGILAGSGVMRIDLTLTVAALGAILGDTASYALGYTFSHRLTQMWPFSKYPSWLKYGQSYFESHGGKSVLLGRFIGPLRSIIPVIAGIMKMGRWQFLIANVLSGIAWSLVYVTPGILIGAASTELSPEGATRLVLLILALLVFVWLLGIAVKWLVTRARHFLQVRLDSAWSFLEKNRYLSHITHRFTPPNESNHAKTAALMACTLLTLLFIAITLLWFTFVDELGYAFDLPIYFFFQSLRTQPFDAFFTLVTCFIHPYTLTLFWAALTIGLMHVRNWRLLRYWLSLLASSLFFIMALSSWMNHLRPHESPLFQSTFSFPSVSLTTATALFMFLIFQLKRNQHRVTTQTLRLTWLLLLVFDGFAIVYLGEHWATSTFVSYATGLCLALLHWIFYRRHIPRNPPSIRLLWCCFTLFIASGVLLACFQLKHKIHDHYPYPEQYVLTNQAWWHQREPLLPMYTLNRFGHPNGVFNIQYLGSLTAFQHALEAAGWKQRPNSFTKRVLSRANNPSPEPIRPFKAPLYLNRKPVLVMTYAPVNNTRGLVLSLWRSNYHLRNHHEPIWLGSLQAYPEGSQKKSRLKLMKSTVMRYTYSPFHQLLPALEGFEFNTLPLPAQSFQSFNTTTYPLLLMIKETP